MDDFDPMFDEIKDEDTRPPKRSHPHIAIVCPNGSYGANLYVVNLNNWTPNTPSMIYVTKLMHEAKKASDNCVVDSGGYHASNVLYDLEKNNHPALLSFPTTVHQYITIIPDI